MSRSLVGIVAFAGLLPLAVDVPPDSAMRTSETRFRVAGGYSIYSFVVTDCQGRVTDQVPVHAYDGAVAVDHRFARVPIRIGVRGGWTRDHIGSVPADVPDVPQHVTLGNRYANPFFDYETSQGSIGIGWVAHQREFMTSDEQARSQANRPANDFSFHLRAGPDTRYLSISWMEGMPIYSDGGYLNVGVGGRPPNSGVSAFMGLMAGGPIRGAGTMVRVGFGATPALRISVSGQTEFPFYHVGSVSIALEYRLHGRAP